MRLCSRHVRFRHSGTITDNPEPRHNLHIFSKITHKKIGIIGFVCCRRRKRKKKKKDCPVLRHSLWGFGRKTAYWVGESWPRHLDLWFITLSEPDKGSLQDYELNCVIPPPTDTQSPVLSQLLHKSLWNPRMVFVNSAAMLTVPTCQMLMWPRVIGGRVSLNELRRETSHFFGTKDEHMHVDELSLKVFIFLSFVLTFLTLSILQKEKKNSGRKN